jgi:hypothetical protein
LPFRFQLKGWRPPGIGADCHGYGKEFGTPRTNRNQ